MSLPDSGRAAESARPEWLARALAGATRLEAPSVLPHADADGWRPLVRHQRPGAGPGGTFNPGWARIGWSSAILMVDIAFAANRASNRARRLNERTHLLGDVGEIFLQWPGSDRYVEIHLTPENQRLQLAWDAGRLEAVRQERAVLEDFVVADPNWIQSVTAIAPTFWSARAVVPIDVVVSGRREFERDMVLLAAVCRYDTSGGESPVLSSTADFQGRPFHTRAAWHQVQLSS